jgi:hypothetical protein
MTYMITFKGKTAPLTKSQNYGAKLVCIFRQPFYLSPYNALSLFLESYSFQHILPLAKYVQS